MWNLSTIPYNWEAIFGGKNHSRVLDQRDFHNETILKNKEDRARNRGEEKNRDREVEIQREYW